jgi:prepilin peptidase CpaA
MGNQVISLVAIIVFPLAMIFGALWDLTTMTIPNWLTVSLAAAFVVIAPFAGLSIEQIGLHAAAGGLALVAGMVLFAFGWIGGGDAKFVAAAALWIGWSNLLAYLIVASVFGGALTLALLGFRRLPLPQVLVRQAWIARLHDHREGVPYGIALAIAGLVIFRDSYWVAIAAGTV